MSTTLKCLFSTLPPISKFGYCTYDVKISRRSALSKALKEYDANNVHAKLSKLHELHNAEGNTINADNILSDMKWISKKYSHVLQKTSNSDFW